MNEHFVNYANSAPRTANADLDKLEQLRHAGYGILTEIGEVLDLFKRRDFYKLPFERDEFIKEIGDVLWYTAIGVWSLADKKVSIDTFKEHLELLNHEFQYEAEDIELPWYFTCNMLVQTSFNILKSFDNAEDEVVKTVAIAELSPVLMNNFLSVYVMTQWFIENLNKQQEEFFTLEEAMDRNLEKLKNRYPEGFELEAVLNKDESKE